MKRSLSNYSSSFDFSEKVENHIQNKCKILWTEDLDRELLRLVKFHKRKNWKTVAEEMQLISKMPELSEKRCREHWTNAVNPKLKCTELTDTEMLLITVYHHKFKNKWAAIAKMLPHRSNCLLKNNFSSLIRKIARKVAIKDIDKTIGLIEHLQRYYACLILIDLLQNEDDLFCAKNVAPLHLKAYVLRTNINKENVLNYMVKSSQTVISRNKSRLMDIWSALNKVEEMKDIFARIASRVIYYHNNGVEINTEAVGEIIEKSLISHPNIEIIPKISPLFTFQVASPSSDFKNQTDTPQNQCIQSAIPKNIKLPLPLPRFPPMKIAKSQSSWDPAPESFSSRLSL